MKFLLDQPFATWDLETTGVDVETARIVTGCVALLRPDTPTWKQQVHSLLVAVDVDIPAEATAIHGITTEHARANGIPPAEAVQQLTNLLANMIKSEFPIAGMNLAFDFTILDRECRRQNLPTLSDQVDIARVVDVHVIDKWVDPRRPGKRKLTDLIQLYGVRHEGAHDSTGDALAAARVAYRMAQVAQVEHHRLMEFYQRRGRSNPAEVAHRFRQLGLMQPHDLHDAQVLWRQQQQGSLGDYLRSKGNADPDCDPNWPIRTWKGGN